MRDFTFESYHTLLSTLASSYQFNSVRNWNASQSDKIIVLRHDVDRTPQNALNMAIEEQINHVSSTYYFRSIPECMNSSIIEQISAKGHEIGYHYENLATYASRLCISNKYLRKINEIFSPALRKELETRTMIPGIFEKILDPVDNDLKKIIVKLFEEGIHDFENCLTNLRKLAPIDTISMHGSPLSAIDNRILWLKYDYRDFGISCEPYFDFDFNVFFYITDASRRWNDIKANKRDNVQASITIPINSIYEIIQLLNNNKLPDKMIINTHPHNWSGNYTEWLKIKLTQDFKNVIKARLIR